MKEYKIGERFEYEGMTLEVVESKSELCDGCILEKCCKRIPFPKYCTESTRSDNKNIVFQLVNLSHDLTLSDYQRRAMTTCTESSRNASYMLLNLVGEVGELSSKIAKAIRKEKAMFDRNELITERGSQSMTDEEIADLKAEAGDILWQLSGFCAVMGWSLDEIGRIDLDKLASRKERGVIVGDGDNR